MGAKAPSKLKLRRPMYKCEDCSKKFLSTQALKSHQQCVHKIKGVVKKPKVKSRLRALLGKAVKKETNVGIEESTSEARRIEFLCPQCPKTFTLSIYAYRHIQKYHCHNEKGEPVSPDSPDIVKPLQGGQCTKCGKPIRTTEKHQCFPDLNLPSFSYVCTGCEQSFNSPQLFDLHVAGLHCDSIDVLFFPSRNSFLLWKEDVERITEAKYKDIRDVKQTYHCTGLPFIFKKGVATICPASIVVNEFSKGVQVHFYKRHYGHPSPDYNIPDKYKKYAITTLMQKASVDSSLFKGIDESDLYVQFKTLMDSIVLDAAKLKISALHLLFEKALQMTTLLNAYDADDSETVPKNKKQRMTDDQITEALSVTPTPRSKFTSPKLQVKSIEQLNTAVNCAPLILNTFSLAEKNDVEKAADAIKPAQVHAKPPVSEANKPVPKQTVHPQFVLPTFNDSYKDFVENNLKCTTKPLCKVEPPEPANSPKVPIKPVRPGYPKPFSKAYVSVNHAVPNFDKALTVEQLKASLLVPSPKEIEPRDSDDSLLKVSKVKRSRAVNFSTKKTAKRTIAKKIVKTKIGQFKPSLSPKNDAEVKRSSRSSVGSATKIDFEYEVKEQENDCNILILKI